MSVAHIATRDSDHPCIVVNPRKLSGPVRVCLENDRRVMIFDDLEQFERWRSRCPSASDLSCEVETVLRALGHDCARLPRVIAAAIERIARGSMTPTVQEFVRFEKSERTFYRRWNELLSIRPKQFLDRVRFLHALRLIEEHGFSLKEAAAVAGYGSADRLRADARQASVVRHS